MKYFFIILFFTTLTCSGQFSGTPYSKKQLVRNPVVPTYDTTYSDTMQIITGSNAPSVATWNTLSNSGSAPHSVIKTATVSGKTFSTLATANWPVISGSTANNTGGEDTDDGGGFFFPAAVQRTIIFANVQTYNGTKSTAQIRISGLTPGAIWVNQIVPSRDVTGAVKEGYVVIHDATGVHDVRTYSDGTQANRAGVSPTGNGVYYAGNTSKHMEYWSTVDSNGEINIAILGTAASPTAQQVFALAGYRGFYATITSH